MGFQLRNLALLPLPWLLGIILPCPPSHKAKSDSGWPAPFASDSPSDRMDHLGGSRSLGPEGGYRCVVDMYVL